jgi:hypothetical protein
VAPKKVAPKKVAPKKAAPNKTSAAPKPVSAPVTTPSPVTTAPAAPVTTTPPAKTSSSMPITAGNSKGNCIYVGGATQANVASVEQTVGHTFNCIETFEDADPQWSDIVDPWITDEGGWNAWAATPGNQVIVTQNAVPDAVINANPTGWEAVCASGAYDSYEKQFAQKLISSGMGSAVIRLGHEMNGTWYLDSLPDTTAGDAAWAQCFARVVTDMRSVSGANFLFDWNINPNVRNISLASYYPGNAYVDIIGVDLYDQFGDGDTSEPVGSAGRFAALAAQPGSLNDIAAFAAANNKPLSFPEWGTVISQGDDPAYVSAIANFVNTHDVAYQSYFDDGAQGTTPLGTQAPNSLQAYITNFG